MTASALGYIPGDLKSFVVFAMRAGAAPRPRPPPCASVIVGTKGSARPAARNSLRFMLMASPLKAECGLYSTYTGARMAKMTPNARLAIAAAATVALIGCSRLPASPPAGREVSQLFQKWARPDSPGCSVGISRDGQLVYERGFGMANLELRVPIAPTSVFE